MQRTEQIDEDAAVKSFNEFITLANEFFRLLNIYIAMPGVDKKIIITVQENRKKNQFVQKYSRYSKHRLS